jgi:hypothetical protein
MDFLYLCPQLLNFGPNDVLHLLALCEDLSLQDRLGVGEHLNCLDLVTQLVSEVREVLLVYLDARLQLPNGRFKL